MLISLSWSACNIEVLKVIAFVPRASCPIAEGGEGVDNEHWIWSYRGNCTQFRQMSIHMQCHFLPLCNTCVGINHVHPLWTVAFFVFVLSTCVLILWVLPFLLLAASRRHSRSTSALSTADSVGQSGEQVLTA